ncbi:MAG: protein kinase, partial [Holophagales bacterium]|nr:protein kinase [Holophagales bacterium]
MDVETWRRVKDVLDRVGDMPPAERPEAIDEACAGDEELRAEVLRFAALDERADTFIDDPLWRVLPGEDHGSPPVNGPGKRVGPYRLERLLGRGGMGEVYLAVREDDYEQKVALKRTAGPAGYGDLLERFVNERQILAGLQHPGIGRLLDGGTDSEGLPYLVMEYVEGVPIDGYCDENQLSLRQRLRLMSKVCRIVHHAHRSLVVHRDLKPSNIL